VVENQNWTIEFAQSFKNLKALYSFLEWPISEEIVSVSEKFPIFIPPTLAKKIKAEGPQGILASEFLPHALENDSNLNSYGHLDPIGDRKNHKAPQLIHRYPSRVLFTPTTICPVHCRYCFRKNELNAQDDLFHQDFEKTLHYLTSHPEINEIIFTGGDPLTLSNERIGFYLRAFSNIKSVKDIRFHTRYPVILPKRIDNGLLDVLQESIKSFRTLSVAIHANHKIEFDDEARIAIKKLGQTGIQLLSQTVLLKGVNDNSDTLTDLINEFMNLRIRPYYLHHPDRVVGGMHFYLPLEEGRKIYQNLRSNLPGWAIPHYVIDVPEGHGKVSAFNPEGFEFRGEILSLSGTVVSLQEPDFFV
jgi:lysine 2,3-aminomutase